MKTGQYKIHSINPMKILQFPGGTRKLIQDAKTKSPEGT